MGGSVRKTAGLRLSAKFSGLCGAAAVAALLAGCSSDVSRFNYPAFGLTAQNPQDKPTPSEPIYGDASPAHAEGYSPAGAPPPNYNNSNYGDNGQQSPRYIYRGPASASPNGGVVPNYGAPGYAYNGAPGGFGTVQGQPESYHPERLASNGQTAYITAPANGLPTTTNFGSPAAQPGFGARPTVLPPLGSNAIPVRPHRPQPGELVEVMPGETLYQFARRNGVSISALMQANNMRSPMVQGGEKLLIPGKGGRSILPPTASFSPVAPAASSVATTVPAAAAPSAFATPAATAAVAGPGDNPDGSYTVRAGDSVYGIARKHNVRPEDIMAANGITDVTKVKFGQVLKMPASPGVLKPLASALAHGKSTAAPATRLASLQPLPGKAAMGGVPVMSDAVQDGIPDGTSAASEDGDTTMAPGASAPMAPAKSGFKTANLSPAKPAKLAARKGPIDPASAPLASAAVDAAAGSDSGGQTADVPSDGRFRWPVRGRIIGKFGPAGKAGQQNEGIDLAVPLGTEVHAAENGVVAYAGDELKGYGKLVLIRHADNWVTAYAHNDELLVKRGDQIRRGQVIAKAGKSGGIDQPLLHFELRKGSQPVDPMPHMASN